MSERAQEDVLACVGIAVLGVLLTMALHAVGLFIH